jgi:subtilase family serine protease
MGQPCEFQVARPQPPARRLGHAPFPPPPPAKPASVTPAVVRAAYGVGGVAVDRSPNATNKQAVVEFTTQSMNATDLRQWFRAFVPAARPGDDTVHAFHGEPAAVAAKVGGDEAMLDIEFIMGLAPGVRTDFYLYGGADFCAGLKNWTSHVLADDDAPRVQSVSYGFQHGDEDAGSATDRSCTPGMIQSVDADLAKMAAKGVSVLFASGDAGSGYAPDFCAKELQVNRSLLGSATAAVDPMCTLGYGEFPCRNETVDAAGCCALSGSRGR